MHSLRSLKFHISLGFGMAAQVASSTQPNKATPATFNPILPRVPATKHRHSRRIPELLIFLERKRASSGCSAGQDVCDDSECCAAGTYCYQSGCCTNQQVGCAGLGCCPTGLMCCSNGDCCPMSYSCVPGGGCCPPGQECKQPNNPPAIVGQAQPLRQQVAGLSAPPLVSSSSKQNPVSSTKKSKSSSPVSNEAVGVASSMAPSSSIPTDNQNSPANRATTSRSKPSSQTIVQESITILPNGETSIIDVYITQTAPGTNIVTALPSSATSISAAATPPIGTIIGTLIGVIIAILLVYWFVRRRLRNTEYDDNQPFWDVDDIPPSHAAEQMNYTEHNSQLTLIRRGDHDSLNQSTSSHYGISSEGNFVAGTVRSTQPEFSFERPSPSTSYPPSSISGSQSDPSRGQLARDHGASRGRYPKDVKQPVILALKSGSNSSSKDTEQSGAWLTQQPSLSSHPNDTVSLMQLTDMVNQLQSEVSRLHVVGGKDDPNYIPPPVYQHALPKDV